MGLFPRFAGVRVADKEDKSDTYAKGKGSLLKHETSPKQEAGIAGKVRIR